ncbi:MAG: hypothetical protein GXY83_39890 [Rhodopirellula sp.]|nr:hypothetical protein [Rhodopirellula sp.]
MAFDWPEFDNDDSNFMTCVEELAHGLCFAVPRFQIFRVDNWFGPKWLGFCGKVVGAVGCHQLGNVVVPPFVQNRLTAQSLFVRNESGGYDCVGEGPQIHHIGASSHNLRNRAKNAAPDTTLIWISGKSLANRRGSFMIYSPGPKNYLAFYVEFQKKDSEWSVSQHKDISPSMVAFFRGQAYRFTRGK